jgi:ribonuclease HI
MLKDMKMHEFSKWMLPHFFWGIWKERNNRIFRDDEVPSKILPDKITKCLVENFSVIKGGNPFDGGNKGNKDKDKRSKRQEAKWIRPPEGWHKANFDGVAKGILGQAGCGGIIRNRFGVGVAAIFFPLGHQTNHFAKASAALHVIRVAENIGVRNLWLEGDSNNIIHCIRGETDPSWTISNIIEEIKAKIRLFDKVHISHVFQEANAVAD